MDSLYNKIAQRVCNFMDSCLRRGSSKNGNANNNGSRNYIVGENCGLNLRVLENRDWHKQLTTNEEVLNITFNRNSYDTLVKQGRFFNNRCIG